MKQIDATLGGGGHSALLLDAHCRLRLIGLDQDPTARIHAAERLFRYQDAIFPDKVMHYIGLTNILLLLSLVKSREVK